MTINFKFFSHRFYLMQSAFIIVVNLIFAWFFGWWFSSKLQRRSPFLSFFHALHPKWWNRNQVFPWREVIESEYRKSCKPVWFFQIFYFPNQSGSQLLSRAWIFFIHRLLKRDLSQLIFEVSRLQYWLKGKHQGGTEVLGWIFRSL